MSEIRESDLLPYRITDFAHTSNIGSSLSCLFEPFFSYPDVGRVFLGVGLAIAISW
jgi:hypothetical protein